MKAANIELDRRVLADLAVRDEAGFNTVVAQARAALQGKVAAKV
jgi:large subunit ribosomal protein L20